MSEQQAEWRDSPGAFLKGTVEAAGQKFYISRVDLHRGNIRIIARAPGPLEEITDAPVTVTGSDGHLVCRSTGPALSVPAVWEHGVCEVTVTLSVNVTG